MESLNKEVGSDLVAAPRNAVIKATVNVRMEDKNLPPGPLKGASEVAIKGVRPGKELADFLKRIIYLVEPRNV